MKSASPALSGSPLFPADLLGYSNGAFLLIPAVLTFHQRSAGSKAFLYQPSISDCRFTSPTSLASRNLRDRVLQKASHFPNRVPQKSAPSTHRAHLDESGMN